MNRSTSPTSPFSSTLHVELVDDVSRDPRQVRVAGEPDPLPLRCAIQREVFAMGTRFRWKELTQPEQLQYSAIGSHVVATRHMRNEVEPYVMATLLTHEIENWHAGQMQCFSVVREHFFRSSEFMPYCGRGVIEQVVNEVAGDDAMPLDTKAIDLFPKNADLLLEQVIYVFRSWGLRAVDRATLSAASPSRLPDLYETFYRGCELLIRRHGCLALLGVALEFPFLALLRSLEQLSGKRCFQPITFREAQGSDSRLAAVLVFTKPTVEAAIAHPWEAIRQHLRRSYVAASGGTS
jgi:hypothetical protein